MSEGVYNGLTYDQWAARVAELNVTHMVKSWCGQERCHHEGCREVATHKVDEVSGPEDVHPLTAYLCCVHFREIMGRCTMHKVKK